ncbi:hypothetical protein GCM10009858_30640 [Terrabacter carboxydivorans]|uniref:Uncharacterized protein n=1 Tax=Terrabacter carboxydivorans TaxID=619730 RepID=A0ABP5Z8I1_9MICO
MGTPAAAPALETQNESTTAFGELAPARDASAVLTFAVEQIVASPVAHAFANAIDVASAAFCTERRWDMTEPTSALMASIPVTTPHETSTVTMSAAAPRSRRPGTAPRFSRRIA